MKDVWRMPSFFQVNKKQRLTWLVLLASLALKCPIIYSRPLSLSFISFFWFYLKKKKKHIDLVYNEQTYTSRSSLIYVFHLWILQRQFSFLGITRNFAHHLTIRFTGRIAQRLAWESIFAAYVTTTTGTIQVWQQQHLCSQAIQVNTKRL
jgi:hypothetical protein